MIENLPEMMALLGSTWVWVALLIGIVSGILVGAIPGLSATMGVALLIPFTFDLEIMPALALLIGIYSGAVYGGTLPAILFRTPGTPASAATLMDGYPMMQAGEPGRALGLAAWSAFVGGSIGTLLLIFLTPQISRFALSFGPAEFFALAILGLSLISALAGGSFIKGAIATSLGLAVATVGMDPLTGYPRFLFGSVSLMEGMPLIPVLIGLFAITEVLDHRSGGKPKTRQTPVRSVELPQRRDVRSTAWTSVKSAFLGTFTGSTPGAGCDIAAFLCYGEARRRAKKGDCFNKGEPKGIAAAESGKTAATSGAMIPLLSLGVPGDAVTAVLIGAFILHGIQPGPLLFADHAPIAYSIFIIMLFAHFGVFGCALLSARAVTTTLRIDQRLLKTGILFLGLMGAYALRANIVDCWIALAFGLVGLGMRRTDIPAAPFLLARILGGMAETSFRRGLIAADGSLSFISDRPLALVLLSLAAILIAGAFWRRR